MYAPGSKVLESGILPTESREVYAHLANIVISDLTSQDPKQGFLQSINNPFSLSVIKSINWLYIYIH